MIAVYPRAAEAIWLNGSLPAVSWRPLERVLTTPPLPSLQTVFSFSHAISLWCCRPTNHCNHKAFFLGTVIRFPSYHRLLSRLYYPIRSGSSLSVSLVLCFRQNSVVGRGFVCTASFVKDVSAVYRVDMLFVLKFHATNSKHYVTNPQWRGQ